MTDTSAAPITTPGLWRRLACLLYESILLFGVLFTTSYFFSVITQTRHALANRHAQQVVLFLALGLYFVWSWRKGYTLAMKTWRIKIISEKNLKPVSWQQASLRFLLAWIWVIPPLLFYAFFSGQAHTVSPSVFFWLALVWIMIWALLAKLHPKGQFWHDALAKTQLIHDDRGGHPKAGSSAQRS